MVILVGGNADKMGIPAFFLSIFWGVAKMRIEKFKDEMVYHPRERQLSGARDGISTTVVVKHFCNTYG